MAQLILSEWLIPGVAGVRDRKACPAADAFGASSASSASSAL